jgi:plastocyanin
MRLAIATAVVAIALAGCGGDDEEASAPADTDTGTSAEPAPSSSGASGGATTKLDISADPSGALKFDKTKLNAKAGDVTITMDNPSSVPHGVSIEGNGVDAEGQVVNEGEKSTSKANLKPGTYTFYCPVPGHEEAGMKGTLTLK